jgi:hypothetical protein
MEQLTGMFWTLRYQYDELRAELERSRGASGATRPLEGHGQAGPVPDGFVPLSSLKQKQGV